VRRNGGVAALTSDFRRVRRGFNLPWSKSGIADLGPSVGYIFASLGLFFAAAGATWSVDAVIRPRLGRFASLAGSYPAI
jgi:thiosulfate dehydrogenase (quinone) large subunit